MKREGTSCVYMSVALPLLTALALLIDAGVHPFVAPGHQDTQPGTVSQGTLFLLETAALVAGIYVLARGSRAAYALALAVALSAFAAVVLYRLWSSRRSGQASRKAIGAFQPLALLVALLPGIPATAAAAVTALAFPSRAACSSWRSAKR